MRCRRVRSFLSAYCNGELGGRLKAAISEHLATCSSCRREEAVYQSLAEARGNLNQLSVSDDFNGRLLNRVARERFAETRTKAYLPRRAPVLLWRQAIPAFVSTSLIILLAFAVFPPGGNDLSTPGVTGQLALDDSYLTVQPVAGTDRTAKLDRGWTLSNQMERAARMNQLSNAVAGRGTWPRSDRSLGLTLATSQTPASVPYVSGYYRVRPVVKIYLVPQAPVAREAGKVY